MNALPARRNVVELRDYRQPPSAPEAEACVLGAILMGDGEAFGKVIEVVDDSMFYREGHRRIFRSMSRLFAKGAPLEPISVREELSRSGELDAIGGLDYILELLDSVPTAANVEYHAGLVRDSAVLRRLIEAASTITRDAYEPGERTTAEVLDAAGVAISEVARADSGGGLTWIKKDVWSVFEMIEQRQNTPGGITGISSGLHAVDQMTGGFQKSDLIIVGARPGMGKTAFMLRIALEAAVHQSRTVGVFSLEMSKPQLIQRMLCAEGMVDLGRLLRGQLVDDDYVRLAQVAGPVSNAQLHIDGTGGLSITQLRARARSMRAKNPDLALILVDYLQLMSSTAENRNQEIGKISGGLKTLAKELDVPVIALSQLSRDVETRNDRRPHLSDLRDSGSLEQDADVVMFLYRDDYYMKKHEAREKNIVGITECIIAKQRNGPTGTAEIRFREAFTRFDNL